ncbi:MAG: RNA-binding transcriptional accessory protein [Anaerolineaceae bacterium 4572_5.2]|nr:MAG: RNA-binding transcriptional accessory protein [Anaerolineaceae bacterium 4572_5.2]
MFNIPQKIAAELKLTPAQVIRTIELFDEDNTIPFVARYRKEVTGGLDEEQLRQIKERLTALRKLAERKETVLRTIEEQGKLSDDLRAKIEAAGTMQALEDLYLPYKPKRRTRATIARERGLEPLADAMLTQQDRRRVDFAALTGEFLNADVPDMEAALAGARDIIAEKVTERAETRAAIREYTNATAYLAVAASKDAAKLDERKVYEMYYDFRERLQAIPPHRRLAINRGEREGVLKVKLEIETDRAVGKIESQFITHRNGSFTAQLQAAIKDAYKRLLGPSIEREVRQLHREEADEHAIHNFGLNLKNLLLQAPLKGKIILGIDPGFRSGCKVAAVDATGKFLGGTTIYPHPPQKQWSAAKETLRKLMTKTKADILAIGNGTASRETESLAAEVIKEAGRGAYVMVNEAGASVYSASPLARKEFPDLDVSMRGAISIARRLQDPLAELVKIDPQSIGVGLYQHDVNQKRLGETLDAVVESAVNNVGVDVNTASPALLRYTAGVTSRVANALVAHRDKIGIFSNRRQLKKVKGLGDKTYRQAIGFLKVPDGDNPLDNTFIHPESYPVVKRLFEYLDLRGDEADLPARIERFRMSLQEAQPQSNRQAAGGDMRALAELLEVGEPTLIDILESLAKPGRDPRDDLPAPLLRADVLAMEDLKPGMSLKGTVRNVVDFGAFVDIGVKQDGLVHISQLADRYIKSPHEVVSVGDVVQLRVLSVEPERGRIALSMKQ